MASQLTQLRADYDRDGFVVVPNVLGEAEIVALRDEAGAIATGTPSDILGSDAAFAVKEERLHSI